MQVWSAARCKLRLSRIGFRINFGGVFDTAGPADTLAAQKLDATVREKELLTIGVLLYTQTLLEARVCT